MYWKLGKVLCMIAIFLLPFIRVNAQNLSKTVHGTISLSVRNMPLREVLVLIEQQSDISFSYESSLFKNVKPITFRAIQEPFDECLDRLFRPLSLQWHSNGKYIILKKMLRTHTYTISGYVTDESGETLLGATLQDRLTNRGTATNNYGFYSLSLPQGNIELFASYVGFREKEITFNLKQDTVISFSLPERATLQEVVVEGENRHSSLLSAQTGKVQLSGADIRDVPSVFSSPDLVKRLQMLPGVASGTELIAGMYVRGGNSDENLFLIDGNPVYQINHLAGLFSAFNSDAIKTVDFYKSSFPARYGGRLSSVVDVRTKDGDMKHFHGVFSVGLTEGRIQLEGPIIKDKTSFNIALRRTWLDVLTAPVFAILNAKSKEDKYFFRYAFHDLNAKITHHFSYRSHLNLSVYSGNDVFKTTDKYDLNDAESVNNYNQHTSMKWGNIIASLNWNYEFNNHLYGNISVVSSRYRSRMNDYEKFLDGKKNDSSWLNTKISDRVNQTTIQDLGYRADFDYRPSSFHHIRFGSDYLYHIFSPQENRDVTVSVNGGKDKQLESNSNVPSIHAHEFSLYVEDEMDLFRWWRMNIGVRGTLFSVRQQTYLSVQPRFSTRFLLSNRLSLKVSYSKMNQYVHMLSTTYLNLPSDLWVPVTNNIRPMLSRQISLGLYYKLPWNIEACVEGYYKNMQHVIDYRDSPRFFPAYEGWEKKVVEGTARGYGLEVSLKHSVGRISAEASYALSWAERRFAQHNEGNWYPSRFDNRHKFNLSLAYRFNKKWEAFAAWTYATGNWVTYPLEQYNGGATYEHFNNIRMPAYHRLDVGVNLYTRTKRGNEGIWNFSLYNAYCRFNPFLLDVKTLEHYDEKGGYHWDGIKSRTKGVIPIIPSFSYTLKF